MAALEATHQTAPSEVPSALTWRSLLAIVFACVVVQPAVMYLYLVSGTGLTLSTWLVILLWSEMGRFFGRPVSKQELFIINAFEFAAVSSVWVFLNPVKNLFFVMSPITRGFGFTKLIPPWWAPSSGVAATVWAANNLFQPAWAVPLLILILTGTLGLAADIAMGYFCYQIYVVAEELPFPMATASAQSIVTIADREPERVRVLMLSALGGIIYGLLSHFLPFITGSSTFMIAPRGIRDLSYLTEYYLTGSSFGLDTTLTMMVSGFILSFPVLVVMLITSFGAYFVGNHYLYEWGIWPEWVPGMQVLTAYTRSGLYFWNSVLIGVGLAAAFVPLALRPRTLTGAFKALSRSGGKGGGATLWLLMALFLGSTLAAVGLVYFLVPGFPLWILIAFSVGWSFFASFVSANAMGVGASTAFSIPYLRESVIYFSGYRGVDIWFANYLTWGTGPNIGLPLISTGGASIATYFKQAEVVGARKEDYVKALLLVTAVSWLMSLVFTSLFLNVAAIPSSAYPYTITGWPVEVQERNRWINWLWSGILFKPDVILGSFAVGAAITVASTFLHLAYIPIAVTWGVLNPMPTAITQFVGGALGRFVFARLVGRQKWGVYAPLIMIGMFIGDAIIFMIDSAILLAIKSQWLLPY